MYLGLILVCGLNPSAVPTATNGCIALNSNRLFMTEEQCVISINTEGIPQVNQRLPEGARVADWVCAQLSDTY